MQGVAMTCYVHVMACEASLVTMMPVDLAAMLQHVRVDMPLVIVAITAQLWEPYAVEYFMNDPAIAKAVEGAGRLTAVAIRKALHSMIIQINDLALAVNKNRHMHHLMVLKEQGTCRHFGVIAFCRRLGILAPMEEQGAASQSAASKTVTLGIMQQQYILLDTTVYIQDMLNLMAKAWKPPTNPAGIDKWQNDIGNTLQRLPAWARQGSDSKPGTYIIVHIKRKALVLLCMHPESPMRNINWKDVSKNVWQSCCPDVKEFMSSLPVWWRMQDIMRMAPSVSPVLYQCFCCLLHGAFAAQPGARQLVTEAGAVVFENARNQLTQELPDIPSPTMVIERALKLAQAEGV